MPRIRLLVSVAGERGQVRGDAGEVLDVDAATARAWADGERAERVIDRGQQPAEQAIVRPGGVGPRGYSTGVAH